MCHHDWCDWDGDEHCDFDSGKCECDMFGHCQGQGRQVLLQFNFVYFDLAVLGQLISVNTWAVDFL